MDAASAHAIFAQADPVEAFGRDPVLWGPLAGDGRLIPALRKAHERAQAFVRDNVPAGAAT
jgi:D-arabinitol 4-dehydrogenase